MAAKKVSLEERLNSCFPPEWLQQEARSCGMVKRRRKIDPVVLFWVLVLGFATGTARTLSALRRCYETKAGVTLAPPAFYRRFTSALAVFLKRAFLHAMEELGGAVGVLRESLKAFGDLFIGDATVLRLHPALARAYAGCRTNHSPAAAKLHLVMSVLSISPKSVSLTGERVNERKVLRIGPWVKGALLLLDLGYYGWRFFDRIARNEGFFVSRLKSNANLRVVQEHRHHRGRARVLVGRKLGEVLRGLTREVLDVEVEVSFWRRGYCEVKSKARRTFRVVGLMGEDNQRRLYLTNAPPEMLAAELVGKVYQARWCIELVFKEMKSGYGLDELSSRNQAVVESLVYATLLVWVASRVLLHALRRMAAASGDNCRPLLWAAVLATNAEALLKRVLEAAGVEPIITDPAVLLLHQAIAPHKRRPHVLSAVQQPNRYFAHNHAGLAA